MKKRILIVDYDQNFIQQMKSLFSEEDFELEFASDASKALAALEKKQFELLITEAMLPKKSGFELSLEAVSGYPLIKTIIVSGVYKGLLFRHQAMKEFKAADFFEKPINIQVFKNRVSELLCSFDHDTLCEKVVELKSSSRKKRDEDPQKKLFEILNQEKGRKEPETLKESDQQKQKQQINSSEELKKKIFSAKSEEEKKRPLGKIEGESKKLAQKISRELIELEALKNSEVKNEPAKSYHKLDQEISRKLQETVELLKKEDKKIKKNKRQVFKQDQQIELLEEEILKKISRSERKKRH